MSGVLQARPPDCLEERLLHRGRVVDPSGSQYGPVAPRSQAQWEGQEGLSWLLTIGKGPSKQRTQAPHTLLSMVGARRQLPGSVSVTLRSSTVPCCHRCQHTLCFSFPGGCLHRQEPVKGTEPTEYSPGLQNTVPSSATASG